MLSLLIAAISLGDLRERRLVVTVCALLGLAFPVLFYAWVDRFTGFGLQGREVLPVLMLIPLVAGEVVNRHSPRFERRPLGKGDTRCRYRGTGLALQIRFTRGGTTPPAYRLALGDRLLQPR